jgi:naphthoate synthase
MDRPGWTSVEEYQDITHLTCDGVARIAFNRPEVRNAVRPGTLFEMQEAFRHAGNEPSIGVVLLTGNGPAKDREWAWLP